VNKATQEVGRGGGQADGGEAEYEAHYSSLQVSKHNRQTLQQVFKTENAQRNIMVITLEKAKELLRNSLAKFIKLTVVQIAFFNHLVEHVVLVDIRSKEQMKHFINQRKKQHSGTQDARVRRKQQWRK